jgi:DNA helicase-2/ATP-dependent DNA helicase PcrA
MATAPAGSEGSKSASPTKIFQATTEQTRVIEASKAQRILVEAAPGTGKTETVARRLHFLLGKQGLVPSEVLVLAFSRAAVQVLVERLRTLQTDETIVEEIRYLTVRTFDSWTFRMLRLLGAEAGELLRNEHAVNISTLATALEKRGGDLLRSKNLGLSRVRHVVVDEVQDLTGTRAVLVRNLLKLLCPPKTDGCGFTLLGDPCQSIYDWTLNEEASNSMLSSDLLAWLKRSYARELTQIPLGKNHRSSAPIINLIDKARILLSAPSANRRKKSMVEALLEVVGDDKAVTLEVLAQEVEKTVKAGQSLAILCRDNGQVLNVAAGIDGIFEEQKKSPPVMRVLGGSLPRVVPAWIGRFLWRFEAAQLTRRGFDRLFEQLTSPLYQGNKSLAWGALLRFARLGEDEESISMDALRQRISWPDSFPDDEGEAVSAVTLTTIHQSKGREYGRVRLVAPEVERIVKERELEEARVIYVGLTRARQEVTALEMNDEPFFPRDFKDRRRWYRWNKTRHGTFHVMELGCDGDLQADSSVRVDVLGSKEEVERVQELLRTQESRLLDSPVELHKICVSVKPLRVVYRVLVKLDDKTLCLGQLEDFVRQDVRRVVHEKQKLPSKIYNLRISAITTCVSTAEPDPNVPSPWRMSGIWLAPVIHGLGRFHTYWNNADE